MIRVYGTISGDPDVFIGTLEVDSDGAIKATVAGPDPRFATVLEPAGRGPGRRRPRAVPHGTPAPVLRGGGALCRSERR